MNSEGLLPHPPECVEGVFRELRAEGVLGSSRLVYADGIMASAVRSTHEGSTMPSDNPLVGTWRLLSWENRDVSGGEVIHPLGEDALGYIMYGQDGRMSVAIARADRAGFAAGDLLGGSAEERAHAAETYVSYCGTYEWRGETVIHFVELSLFPNWVGAEQERLAEVAGDRLTLSTRPMVLGGVLRTASLTWERVRPTES